MLPNHSRTSSSASSVGSSYVSSTDSNKESPDKMSPTHSRQGSNSHTQFGDNHHANSEENEKNSINSKSHYNSGISTALNTMNNPSETLNDYNHLNWQQKSYGILHETLENDSVGQNRQYNGIIHLNQFNIKNERILNENLMEKNELDGNDTELIYGTIRPHTKKKPHDEFSYRTLDGSIIRSVHPPGKGKSSQYKVFVLNIYFLFLYLLFMCSLLI